MEEEPFHIKEEPLDVEEEEEEVAVDVDEQWLLSVKDEPGIGQGGMDPSFAEVKLETSDLIFQAGSSRFVNGDSEEEMSTIAEPYRYFIKEEPRIGGCDETLSCSVEVFPRTNQDSACNKNAIGNTVRRAGCSYQFQSSKSISQGKSRVKHYACELCGKVFKACSTLKRHRLTHVDESAVSVSCTAPPTHTNQQSENSCTHTRTKECPSSEKAFQCKVEGESFSESKTVKVHERKPEKKHLSCTHCSTRFSCNSHLQRHLRIHTGERAYSCEVCKKSFTWIGNLKMHIRTHTGDKPYSCEMCKKSFLKRGDLDAHVRTHTGERPYFCQVCNKSFTQKSNLKTHVRTHTGERPFSCELCKKTYTQIGHLQAHFSSHTGDRPYSCEVCKKSFTRREHLKMHIRIHSGGRPFSCEVCKKSFTQRSNLNTHIRKYSH